MKAIKLNIILIILAVFMVISGINAQECKCHSKNSSMRRMHEIIGFKNCGNCHNKNEKLMSSKPKKQNDQKNQEKLKNRIKEDRFCIPCHNPDGTLKKEIYKNSDAMKIINTFYCPKDKLRFIDDIKVCPKCGGKLIDINLLMEESKKNPSNDICRQCHINTEVENLDSHITFKKDKLYNCLECHSGHDDCGGCHF